MMLRRFHRVVGCALGLLCVALAPGAESADATRAREASAAAFVAALGEGMFEAAVTAFDATMKAAMPAGKLRETWGRIEQQSGKFQEQLGQRVAKQGGYNIVFVACRFERAVVEAKVVFGPGEQIAGLFFVPGKAPEPGAEAGARVQRPAAIRESEVTVGSGEWALPGTLTMPAGGESKTCAAVVLVHGSGPQDRDVTVGGSKPFRDLAWGLAAKGVAVLRYDKRTKVYAAKLGAVHPFTTKEEVIDDALAAVRLLQATAGIDPKRVFVLGQSMGGTLAPRIGAADTSIAGLIILAGATRKLEDLWIEQTEYILALDGALSSDDEAKLAQLRVEVGKVKRLQPADAASRSTILGIPLTYWLDLQGYEPATLAARLALPLFVGQGGRDYQVTMKEFDVWKAALAGKSGAVLKVYPKLNHLFIAGEGRASPDDYDKVGHVDQVLIDDLAAWIGAQARRP